MTSTLLSLASVFARIGLGAFGGGLATIPFIHYELVVSRGWLSERAFSEVVSLAQMTPGPLAINAATFVGYRIAGTPGACLATLSVVLAPLALLVSFLFLLSRAPGGLRRGVERIRRALRPAVSGMLLAAFWVVARPLACDWRLLVLSALLLLLSRTRLFSRYPQVLLLCAGGVGALLF